MLVTLRAKNQITLPTEVIKKLNLQKDDRVEVEINENGQIVLTPVMIVEKKMVDDIKEAFDDVENGRVSEAISAYEIIKKLGL
ncbi:AbrB/MazE/SpoVT family DNA-binding domain-containing protein [bacterium AH-315-G05]|nr:AbrB/MazE/SpoVT family DNA-binding domain-containing protein [bacterium AH-315-L21]MBN4062866.1 AbrB/MazE/SpoVT family DNA-binding domain-containing protein [Alkaliphilus sp. AH-315-G20]MBN4067884.1 AbrB/MazE/SpoVT family DNA-binding domain-containing protein [Alkaliphilus transvaalensis]MBN4069692.1 AbrB/MazE/SpoVT family DNA-binding domain-containing protein [bacterium AH-315-G05]